MRGLTVGKLARQVGVNRATVRYYERRGLLRSPSRSGSGYRLYSERVVNEILFIKRAQALGFLLAEIRELLELGRAGTKPCSRVIALAENQLASVDSRIQQLTQFRRQLASAVKKWRRECRFIADGLCALIEPTKLTGNYVGEVFVGRREVARGGATRSSLVRRIL